MSKCHLRLGVTGGNYTVNFDLGTLKYVLFF